MRRALTTVLVAILTIVPLTKVAAAQTESLLIGPGDLIQVDVIDTPELEQQVRVTDAGTVPLAFLGDVHLAGKTPAAAATIIGKALVEKKMMRAPQVTVRIVEYATQAISVVGQVKNAGTFTVTTPQPILKVVAMAGGLTDIADRKITIQRQGSSEKQTYYMANDADAALSDSIMVYPGDTVVVPKAAFIYIMGDVARPGGYAISTNDSRVTILQAIAMAGSANKTAVQSRVRLIRKTPTGSDERAIHLDSIQKGKQPDLQLEPNDVLYVPFSWMKNVAINSAQIASSTSSAAIYRVP